MFGVQTQLSMFGLEARCSVFKHGFECLDSVKLSRCLDLCVQSSNSFLFWTRCSVFEHSSECSDYVRLYRCLHFVFGVQTRFSSSGLGARCSNTVLSVWTRCSVYGIRCSDLVLGARCLDSMLGYRRRCFYFSNWVQNSRCFNLGIPCSDLRVRFSN